MYRRDNTLLLDVGSPMSCAGCIESLVTLLVITVRPVAFVETDRDFFSVAIFAWRFFTSFWLISVRFL